MKDRLFYLLRFYVLTVAIFLLAKLVFMLCNGAGHDVSVGDAFYVLWHGLTLDLSTGLYFLALPFLLMLASLWLSVPGWIFRVYHAIVAVAFSLAFVADTSLYPFWHFKLDASCLQYLETPTEAMASVSAGYLLLRLVLVVVVAAAVYWGYKADGTYPSTLSLRQRLWATLLFLLCVPLFVIGIRGGLSESTTNVGQVYFSQNQFLNHAAINPVFSFFDSFDKNVSYIPDYKFMEESERDAIAHDLFPTESVLPDTLLTTTRPNVVVVLMESCGAMFTELGAHPETMPRLNQLMHEGISFDSCYANSWRTDRGTVCTLSGYPSFPVTSVMKMNAKVPLLPGIAKTLVKEGYEASYLYGGDINFTNMRGYLVSSGFERLTWKNDYSVAEQETSKWGVRDDITFRTLYDMILEKTSRQTPFVIGFSTLSSHEPWDVPVHQFEDETQNAFYYLDTCIGQLVDSLKATPAWDNLLLIFLPDHSINFEETEMDRSRNHIPLVWTGGAVKRPRRIATICNQTDLPATLLGQMDIPHEQFRFSRDVVSRSYTRPFAIHTYNNGISMVDSTGFVVFDLDASKTIVSESNDAERLVRMGQAILQTAADDLKNLQ